MNFRAEVQKYSYNKINGKEKTGKFNEKIYKRYMYTKGYTFKKKQKTSILNGWQIVFLNTRFF